MSIISRLLALQNGAARSVDISTNTLSALGLQLNGSSSGHFSQFAAASTTDYSVFWPAAQGAASSFLQNDGSGNLSWSSVLSSPTISSNFTAGETFAANKSYVVRWAMNSLSETSDEIFKADFDATSNDDFWAIGIAFSPTTKTAGQSITVYSFGAYTLGSGDTNFSSGDIGKPVWLTSSGSFSTTAPTGSSESDFKVGIVMSTNQIWLDGQMMGVGNTSGGGIPVNPLAIEEGGTGQATKSDAFDALQPMSALGDLIVGGSSGTGTRLAAGSNGQVLTLALGIPTWADPAASGGTVTSVSIVTANGFAGSVANSTTTPAVTLSTTISGLLKGAASALTAATAGTDYSAGTASLATGILKSTTSTGALTIATAGDFPTLNQNTTGTAANITASSNSTLTSLPNLSLDYSQLSGTVPTWNQNTTGTAANITGTSNSTLTTLSALTSASSLATVGTITSGVWSGTAIAINHGGTGQTTKAAAYAALSPLSTAGDIVYEDASPAPARLGIGSNGQVLTVVSGLPAWADASVSPGSISLAQNHILVGNASGLAADVAMSGEASIVASGAVTLSNAAVIAKVLTGFTSGAGTVSATDSLLSAIQKLDGNIAGKQATGNYITALTGDATASGPGSSALTLATVNSNVGSFGSSTSIPSFTVNAKGLITAASGNAVVAPAGTLSGTTLNSTVVSSSLTSVGTITTGVWTGTTIAIANGGTGQTSKSAAFDALSPMSALGDIVYGGTSGTGTRLAGNTTSTKQFLVQTGNGTVSAAPVWGTISAGDVPTLNQNTTGSAASFTGSLVGDVTGTQGATVISATTVTGKVLTGFTSGAGTVSASDSILSAIQKLDGNTNAKLTNPMTTLGDTIYGGASGAATRLAGDTSNTRKFLRTLSVTSTATAPVWDTLLAADVPTLNQNTTGTAANLSGTPALPNGTTATTQSQADNSTKIATTAYVDTGLAGITSPSFYRAGQQSVLKTYTFTVTSANATVGATYTNNTQTFTVISTIAAGTTLLCNGTGAPTSSGTLTKATGTGDATIAFSANTNANSTSQVINFSSTLGNTNYAPSVNWRNVTDTNPQFQPVEITNKTALGFVVTWNAAVDSTNYVLEYSAFPNI